MADESVLSKKRQALLNMGDDLDLDPNNPSTEKLRELLDRASPIIDQVNSLYNQYLSGALDRPPEERRNYLDNIMATVSLMAKPTKALRFKFNAIQSKHHTYREKWDKMMRDLESGKIQRRRKGS